MLAILIVVITLVVIALPKFKDSKLTDDLNDVTRENVSGVRVVRAFNAEQYQNKSLKKVNNEITKTNLFTSRTMGILSPFMMFSMNTLTIVIYIIGARLINKLLLLINQLY